MVKFQKVLLIIGLACSLFDVIVRLYDNNNDVAWPSISAMMFLSSFIQVKRIEELEKNN